MPYLNVTTNVPMNRKQKVLIDSAVAKALTIVPKEKPEYLMSYFEDASSLILSGDMEKPCAMVEVRVVTKVYEDNKSLFESIVKVVTDIISAVLNIEPERIYVTCIGSPLWAAAGVDVMTTILK